MSEQLRSLTLRKKGQRKKEISAPKPISGPQQSKQLSNGDAQAANPREKAIASETSDLVKRRYSTRFNQLPDFSAGAPPVPGLPSYLKRSSRGGSPARPRTPQSGPALHVDTNALSDANLQPERYVTDLLSHATEQDIQDYQNSLRRVKNRTDTDLQQSVYQNRTQFIKISKEAEKLKGEIDTLQGLMSELTGVLGHTSNVSTHNETEVPPLNGDSTGSTSSRRRANRSSVANLESMWNVQLQALWKNIERSQKFLPAIPGRHIVMETGQWVELDSATWKAKRPVHIVLLNDHLLVASVKRKKTDANDPNQKGPAPTKLVAEECWPLQDIDVADLSANLAASGAAAVADERDIGTAVNVRAGGKSFTYRHLRRDAAAKNELLFSFRKTLDELRKTLRTEVEQSTPQKNETLAYFASRDPASAKKTDIMDHIGSTKHEILIDVDGKQQNLRWVEGQIDELDIEIACQSFEKATSKVGHLRKLAKGLKNNSVAQELILAKVDERAAQLASTLSRRLVDTPAYLEATKQTTGWLNRLGYEDRARTAFLASRTITLNQRGRACIFEGDLHRYIFQISYVYFSLVKNTVVVYQACFSQLMTSACVMWANGHLEELNKILVRQLGTVERGGNVWKECMEVVWGHEREMLGAIGLDFRETVGRGLTNDGVIDEGGFNGLTSTRSSAVAAQNIAKSGMSQADESARQMSTGSARTR